MAGLLDFLAGGGALKKAAQGPAPAPAPSAPAQPSGIDVAAEAQKAAARAKVAPPAAVPAAPAVGSSEATRHFAAQPIKLQLP